MNAAELLTYAEMACRLGAKSGTLKRWKHEGMPHVALPAGRIRLIEADVRAWIAMRRSNPNKVARLRGVSFARQSFIYFGHGENGLIKIGWTSNTERRATEIECEIVATLPGDKRIEALFHKAFAEDRVEGEWFAPSDRLRAFVDFLTMAQARVAA